MNAIYLLLACTTLYTYSCTETRNGSSARAQVAGSSAAPATANMGGRTPEQMCASACQSAAPLHCPGDDPAACESECLRLYTAAVCGTEIRAYIACSSARPASDWKCDADGEAAVPGYCAAEQNAIDACLK